MSQKRMRLGASTKRLWRNRHPSDQQLSQKKFMSCSESPDFRTCFLTQLPKWRKIAFNMQLKLYDIVKKNLLTGLRITVLSRSIMNLVKFLTMHLPINCILFFSNHYLNKNEVYGVVFQRSRLWHVRPPTKVQFPQNRNKKMGQGACPA